MRKNSFRNRIAALPVIVLTVAALCMGCGRSSGVSDRQLRLDIAENLDDELVLGTIRNWVFFGLENLGTYPKYAGREDSEEHENCVAKLKWRIPKYDK